MYLCYILTIIIMLGNYSVQNVDQNEFCTKTKCQQTSTDNYKDYIYIFYNVNRPEGFNLRRDVYLRMATFIKLLNRDRLKYKLVLPPWSELIHWRSNELNQNIISWDNFFDIDSLNSYIPVIEMKDYISFHNTWNKEKPLIDEIYILKQFKEMFETGDFRDKYEYEESCEEKKEPVYFWGYRNITFNSVKCLKFQGPMSLLKRIVTKSNTSTIMFSHAEIPLHDTWGTPEFWKARRSMRFNKKLVKLADNFRERYLNSTDTKDNVIRPEKWQDEKPSRKAIGGNYISVHLRRQDFLWGRANHIPSIKYAAEQILEISRKLDNTKMIFLATDATSKEITELKSLLERDEEIQITRFIPDSQTRIEIKDGGRAIIDQIICSHAKYFIGTYESTFSFRIQEEREIMGFPKSTTFNRLCGDKEMKDEKCSQTTQWTIMY